MKRGLLYALTALLFAAGIVAQVTLTKIRPGDAPVVKESFVAALGGFRSLVAEVIWFRADRLQKEGRFGELVQLTSLLTALEPHDPEVWNYASWNMSYNIAARMPRAEDRWRWVYAGVELLRDEGLKWNPREPRLYFELADRFEMKIGTDRFDDDARLYQYEWRRIVEKAARNDDWASLGMDKSLMAEVQALYGENGTLDWGNAQASALYWAHKGLKYAKGQDALLLEQKISIARKLYPDPNRHPEENS